MIPIIKIEVDHMKHSILHAFAEHQVKVSEEVQKQLDAVIDNYPFERVIYDAANDVLDKAIKEYFSYGEGYRIIQSAINEALNNAFRK